MIAVEQVKDVPAYIRQMYTDNNFMTQFGVHIGEIKCGSAEVSIDVDPANVAPRRHVRGGVSGRGQPFRAAPGAADRRAGAGRTATSSADRRAFGR